MGTTQNYSIPYPECAPPLRKDPSDIADIRDLAVAADDAISSVYDIGIDRVFSPAAVRVATAASVAGVGQNITPFYSAYSFSQNNGMDDTAAGVVRIIEPGRYWVGAYISMTSAGMTEVRTRFLINGTPVSNFQTPGEIVTANTATGQASAVLSFGVPNSALQTQGRHSGLAALLYTYTSRLWVVQLEKY